MAKPSPETLACPKRYAFKTANKHGMESKRTTYLCKDRAGFMVNHWKCVGYFCEGCPLIPKETLYLRFGKWRDNEVSQHRGVMDMAGVCVYPIEVYRDGMVHITEMMLKPTGENDCAHLYDLPAAANPAFLVTGRVVNDYGPTGEVLLKDLKLVREIPRGMICPPRKSRAHR